MSKPIDITVFYNLTKTVQEQEQQKLFLNSKEMLNNNIKNSMKDCSEKRKELLQLILDMPDKTKDDFEAKEWMYNDGFLRNVEDIEERNKSVSNANYYNTTWQKRKDYRVTDWKLFILQLLMIPLGLFLSYKTKNFSFLFIAAIFKVVLLVSIIVHSSIKSTEVINDARRYNIPSNDSRVNKAYFDRSALILGGIKGARDLKTHSKNNMRELMDPDLWTLHV